MKTLSIKQPWAELIVSGIKDIENRTWRTTHRGRIYVHASAINARGLLSLLSKDQVEDVRNKSLLDFNMINSAIIGEVDIIDCVSRHDSIWAEHTANVLRKIEGNMVPVNVPVWNWVLANPVKYDHPILNVKGKLSLWEYKLSS